MTLLYQNGILHSAKFVQSVDHVHNLNVSHVNWDHLFAKTSRLFCGIERVVIYHHNNLTLLDWSIMKIVQVTVCIPQKPHTWMHITIKR